MFFILVSSVPNTKDPFASNCRDGGENLAILFAHLLREDRNSRSMFWGMQCTVSVKADLLEIDRLVDIFLLQQ